MGGVVILEVLLLAFGAVLAVLTMILSCFQFSNHLSHWRDPDLQKCYLRIVLLAPVYSLFSWLSVAQTTQSANFDAVRAGFEGYTLWTFSLMLYAVGGDRQFHHLYSSSFQGSNDDAGMAEAQEYQQEGQQRKQYRQGGGQVEGQPVQTKCHKRTLNRVKKPACYVLPACDSCTLRTDPCSSKCQVCNTLKCGCCCCYPCGMCMPCGKLFTFTSSHRALFCWKLCLFQFALMKTSLSSVTAYSELHHTALSTDKWVKPLALLSVTVAMWALLSAYISFSSISERVRELSIPTKFLVIKLAIFMTVAQELCFHILVACGYVSSPYCKWVGPSERCLDLMGFETPSARRGVRTVASLVVLEMFCLQFLFLRFFSFTDRALGKPIHQPEQTITIVEFFFDPMWSVEGKINKK